MFHKLCARVQQLICSQTSRNMCFTTVGNNFCNLKVSNIRQEFPAEGHMTFDSVLLN